MSIAIYYSQSITGSSAMLHSALEILGLALKATLKKSPLTLGVSSMNVKSLASCIATTVNPSFEPKGKSPSPMGISPLTATVSSSSKSRSSRMGMSKSLVSPIGEPAGNVIVPLTVMKSLSAACARIHIISDLQLIGNLLVCTPREISLVFESWEIAITIKPSPGQEAIATQL